MVKIFQYTTVRLYKLGAEMVKNHSNFEEANRIQGIVANADYTIAQAGTAGAKEMLGRLYGYGGDCRRPLPPIDPIAFQALWKHPHVRALIELERSLAW